MSNTSLIALQNQIKEKQSADPHIAAKIAAHAIVEKILSIMQDDKGVHVETAFATLGSLAGYACQQSALLQATTLSPKDIGQAIVSVNDKNGNSYLYGDGINKPLLEDGLSVWSLVGGAVQSHGEKLPDINEIVTHTTKSIGTDDFGKPRLPKGHPIRYQPKELLQLWQPVKSEILDVLPVPTSDWGVAFGLAAQSLIDQAKSVLEPNIAAIIVMECAMPMSKFVKKSV